MREWTRVKLGQIDDVCSRSKGRLGKMGKRPDVWGSVRLVLSDGRPRCGRSVDLVKGFSVVTGRSKGCNSSVKLEGFVWNCSHTILSIQLHLEQNAYEHILVLKSSSDHHTKWRYFCHEALPSPSASSSALFVFFILSSAAFAMISLRLKFPASTLPLALPTTVSLAPPSTKSPPVQPP